MAFPGSGLPHRVDVVSQRHALDEDGNQLLDADDNPVIETVYVVQDRPARFYRARGAEDRRTSSVMVRSKVAFDYQAGDDFTEKDEIVIRGAGVNDGRYEVDFVMPMHLWHSQSHWEIDLGQMR